MKKYEIGGIFFDTPYFMAPLAGITDSPFRRLCRKFGAGAVYSEMISAKGMYYNDKNHGKTADNPGRGDAGGLSDLRL